MIVIAQLFSHHCSDFIGQVWSSVSYSLCGFLLTSYCVNMLKTVIFIDVIGEIIMINQNVCNLYAKISGGSGLKIIRGLNFILCLLVFNLTFVELLELG